jgi:hypothetical protein
MLTRFVLRQSCPAIVEHRCACDFSQSFRLVYRPDRLCDIGGRAEKELPDPALPASPKPRADKRPTSPRPVP